MEVTPDLQFDVPNDLDNFRRQNQTLEAQLTIRWSGSETPIALSFPAPYHGVFVLRSSDTNQSKLRYWFPLLIEKPGVWKIKRDNDRSDSTLIRAFPGGYTIQHTSVPSWDFFIDQLDDSGIQILCEDEYKKKTTNDGDGDSATTFDEFDLDHRRLQTYNAYILERFLFQFIKTIKGCKEIDLNDYLKSKYREDTNTQNSVWEYLSERSERISSRLVPVHRLIKLDRLRLFNPLNNIDSISHLTSFRKIRHFKSYNPITHQNHPSFRKNICPIETPESSEVGLTLHLAAGVTTDIWGNLDKTEDEKDFMGYAASLVPFVQHNDSVRVMMGAKNLRQAVNIRGAAPPMIKTGCEQEIVKLNKSLVSARLVDSHFSEYKPGKDLLVAYLPWYGYNFEDAIVANETLRENGGLSWEYSETFEEYLKPEFTIDLSDIKEGEVISKGDPVAYAVSLNGEKIPFTHNHQISGVLEKIQFFSHENPACGGKLEWTIKVNEPLQVGSKLMARYGNKGVISKFISPKEMPRFPDDKQLPRELRGRAVDLLLNPHGVISRMNIGQLMETQYTIAHKLGFELPSNIGFKFEHSDPLLLSDFYKKHPPFDKYGRIHLEFGDNQQTKSPVTVGYQYFTVLKQIPSRKAHARGGQSKYIPYNTVTGQPVEGKARNGGQRIGEMEMWALAAHQADHILDEILTSRSDPSGNSETSQTTQAIKDHLFFLGFKLEESGKVSTVSDNDVVKMGEQQESNKTRQEIQLGVYGCKVRGCRYKLLNGKKLPSSDTLERSDGHTINVETLLSSMGYQNLNFEMKSFQRPDKKYTKILDTFTVRSSNGDIDIKVKTTLTSISADFIVEGFKCFAQLRTDDGYDSNLVMSLHMTCQKHKDRFFVCETPERYAEGVEGGLYDKKLFGNPNPQNHSLGWGYIKLREPIKHPFIKDNVIQCIPILPLKYRYCNPIAFLERNEENELTQLYVEIIELNKKKTKKQKALEEKVQDLYWAVRKRVFGTKHKSKYGLLRRHGLGRRIDFSARLVLVPDPSLDWDEVSLPSSVCGVLFGKDAARYANSDPTSNYLKFCESIYNQCGDEISSISAITEFINENDIRVLVNRAPALHKYNIMSFRPTVHPISEGLVIKLNPIVFKGFGADADGDEMSIHVLKNQKSIDDAGRLSPTHIDNFLSVSDGEPMVDFDQDWVLGNFLIYNEVKKSGFDRIKNMFSDEDRFRDLILEEMRRSFKEVTEKGVSFSFLELLEIKSEPNKIDQILSKFDDDPDNTNQEIEDAVNSNLSAILDNDMPPGYYFAAMAHSKARGTKQTRQILGARGHLSHGLIGFAKPQSDFLIKESLLEGMNPNSAFMSTYNARSSMIDKNMGTYSAGFLTRQLVLALWPWKIVLGDCGAGSISSCKHLHDRRICHSCYDDPDVTDGYPAGLIAAQAIGERCTQLSMSSFHTSQSVSPVKKVEELLNYRKSELPEFLEKFDQIGALVEIKKRHKELLWVALRSLKKTRLLNSMRRMDLPLATAAGYDGFFALKRVAEKNVQSFSYYDHPINALLNSKWSEKI